MSVAQIEQAIKSNDKEDSDSIIQTAAATVWEWAKKQPAKAITTQAVKGILIGAGLSIGPASFVAAFLVTLIIDSKPAY